MVDPFQVLDNGNSLSGTNENQQILLRIKQNMNEESTNLRICNEPTERASNDEEKADFNIPGAKDDEPNSGSVNENLDILKMGVPLNHQSFDINHTPYQIKNSLLKNEPNFQIESNVTFGNDSLLESVEKSEFCVGDNCESVPGILDANVDFLTTNPLSMHPKENEQLTKHFELSVSSSSSSCSSSLHISDNDPSNQLTTKRNNISERFCNSDKVNNCVNTELGDFVTNMETINNCDSPTSTTTDAQETDNRRVEPLKINLHREPIIIKIPKHAADETVPKITIKQIKLPQCGEEDVPKHALIVDSSVSTSNTGQNCSSDPPSEPHVIPKLTIRNSTNSFGIAGQSEIVPKLTIKMDNHIVATAINNKDKSTNSDDGIKLTIKPILEPPIPKLTIKTNSIDCAEVVNNANATKFSVNVGPSSPSSSTSTAANKLNRTTSSSLLKSDSIVPKIKIKQITKTDPLGEVPQFTIAKSDDASDMFTNKCDTKDIVKTVPKLVVKLPKESESDQIKQKTYENDETAAIDHMPLDMEHEIVPKITIRQIKQSEQTANENIIIPKVTIKPIINPNNDSDDSETLITPKITIKPIPKPLDISQPLEIVTTSPTSAIKLADSSNESQQSPRIILKINKTTSETISKNVSDTEDGLTNTNLQQQPKEVPSNNSVNKKLLLSTSAENDLKRTNSTILQTPVDAKRLKLDNQSMSQLNPISNEVINLDSDDENLVDPLNDTSTNNESNNIHTDEKCHQTISQIQPASHQELMTTSTVTPPSPKYNSSNIKEDTIKSKLPFPGNFFLGEDVRPAIPHPLLTHNIERARLLVSMMNADIETPKDEQVKNKRSQSLFILSEGSSSDCIMMGDNGTSLPNSVDFGVGALNENGQNNADRDSGVDVSNSVKSGADDVVEDVAPIKRGRGRPRKDMPTPTVIRKKTEDNQSTPRQFAGVLIPPEDTTPADSNTPQSQQIPNKQGRKRRIRIDDDDESPTFNPLARGIQRGRGRGSGRGSRRGRGSLRKQVCRPLLNTLSSPEKSSEMSPFTSPETKGRRKQILKEISTPSLQVFEEDTRMSADLTTPTRNMDFLQNEESQSSLHSSVSATAMNDGSTCTGTAKKRGKIEVVDPEGRTEFTVEMIAEYDWPPPKGCCPARNRDTYMIQEQVAEYLGVKSFKRKYQELPRRMVEMEERNYLMEKGLVSEKMCDLGLTAVLASDVLDIMHNDFYEKYEEYKRFLREKHIRDLAAKQKAIQAEAVEKNLSAREHAIRAASLWNINFNKSRKEDRRQCLDLQNFVINLPEGVRQKLNRPSPAPSHYPIALVPGQFQDFYKDYSSAELICYPINSALADPIELNKKIQQYMKRRCHDDSDSSSDSDNDEDSSDSDAESSSDSSDDENVKSDIKCNVCDKPQNSNQNNKPELFVQCSKCRRKIHPTCVEMSSRMALRVREYNWQCAECKSCLKCKQEGNVDKMLFCDQCDRGYHIFCIGIKAIPSGRWHCGICSICTLCGTRNAEGYPNLSLTKPQRRKLAANATWNHQYRINEVNNVREHIGMWCEPCTRLNENT